MTSGTSLSNRQHITRKMLLKWEFRKKEKPTQERSEQSELSCSCHLAERQSTKRAGKLANMAEEFFIHVKRTPRKKGEKKGNKEKL